MFKPHDTCWELNWLGYFPKYQNWKDLESSSSYLQLADSILSRTNPKPNTSPKDGLETSCMENKIYILATGAKQNQRNIIGKQHIFLQKGILILELCWLL